ncbi:hypothetical protein [Amycolatopsis thermoflava]|uniref:hypothetical protein n=1 Tax=Amycolatopsis thermoflava TaxID=84480 RepID=UPI003824AEF0
MTTSRLTTGTIDTRQLIDPTDNRVTILGPAHEGYVSVRFADGTENAFPADAVTPDAPKPSAPSPSAFAIAVLLGLQSQRHVYGGTVPAETVARRRAKNRAARRSRRINRLRGAR